MEPGSTCSVSMAAASMAALKTSDASAMMSLSASLSTTVWGAREALLVTNDRCIPALRAALTLSAAWGTRA